MPTFVVEGGLPLRGTIRPAGNKNGALPALAATLQGFRHLEVACTVDGDALVVHGDRELVVDSDAFGHVPRIEDGPWPAFPADLTSIALVTPKGRWW